jgi:hypothetical protein
VVAESVGILHFDDGRPEAIDLLGLLEAETDEVDHLAQLPHLLLQRYYLLRPHPGRPHARPRSQTRPAAPLPLLLLQRLPTLLPPNLPERLLFRFHHHIATLQLQTFNPPHPFYLRYRPVFNRLDLRDSLHVLRQRDVLFGRDQGDLGFTGHGALAVVVVFEELEGILVAGDFELFELDGREGRREKACAIFGNFFCSARRFLSEVGANGLHGH